MVSEMTPQRIPSSHSSSPMALDPVKVGSDRVNQFHSTPYLRSSLSVTSAMITLM